MSKSSGRKKVAKGILKFALLSTPLFAMAGGAIAMGVGIDGVGRTYQAAVDTLNDFRSTSAYVQQYEQDLDRYTYAYMNDKITEEQYTEGVKWLDSNPYAESVMEKYADAETLQNYGAIVKNNKASEVTVYLGLGVFTGMALGIIVGTKKALDLADSAKEDIKKGKREIGQEDMDKRINEKVNAMMQELKVAGK